MDATALNIANILSRTRGMVVTPEVVERIACAIREGGEKKAVIDRIERVVCGDS